MAKSDEIKTIREEIKALKEKAGITDKMMANDKTLLNSLRERLKLVRGLKKEHKKVLDDTFNQSKNEEVLLKLKKSQSKIFQNIGKTLEEQLKQNIKVVKGEMGIVDKLKMQFSWRKQEQGIQDLSKKIEEAKANNLTGQVKKMEVMKDILEDNLKSQKDLSGLNQDGADAADELKSSIEGAVPGLKSMKDNAKKFGKALMANPMAVIAIALIAIVTLMAKVVKAGMELQKELGLSVRETFKLQATLMAASFEMAGLGISAAEIKDTAMGLVNEFGSFENVTKETLVTMSKMNTEFGIAGTTSAALLGVMESVSSSTREQLTNQMAATAELARAAGVAPGHIMADVASDTEFFSKYAKDGGKNVMEAAIQAKKLGLNMSTVSAMADSLLDFESSIESQMEASMMLGRSINTDKARQLALSGDLVGMQKEVMKQVGNEADFNKMNVLQRQALAKAFGLSVTDLGKMVRDQEVLNNMTAEERAAREKQAALLEKSKKHMMDFVARVKEIGMMLFTTLLPAFKLIGAAVVLISIVLKPFIEGVRIILPILLAMGAALGVIALIFVIMNAQLVITSILSWLAAAPWYAIPLLIIGIIGLVSLLLKKFGVFTILNDYLVKPIKEAWARFKEFVGGMETIKKILKVAFMIMFAPVLAIPLIIWGVIKAFKMLAEKVGGFGNLIKIALAIAFLPLTLALGAIKLVIAGAKKLAGFFGGLFGGGEEAAPKPRKQSRSARQREYRKRTNKPRRFESFDDKPWEERYTRKGGASPAESMAAGSIVNTATSAIVGEAGPEAVVPLGDKFDLTTTNELLTTLIAQSKAGTDKLTKKVGDMGVAG